MKTLYRSILDDDEKVLSKDKDMLDIFTILNTILKYIPNRKWDKIYYKARSVGARSDHYDHEYQLFYDIRDSNNILDSKFNDLRNDIYKLKKNQPFKTKLLVGDWLKNGWNVKAINLTFDDIYIDIRVKNDYQDTGFHIDGSK